MTATTADLEKYIGRVELSREYKRSLRSTLRGWYSWLYAKGIRKDNPAETLLKIKPKPPLPHPCPDIPYYMALKSAPERERLMLRLAAEAGLRRGEVCRIHSRDIVEDLTGLSLIVHGKGDKERIIPLSAHLGTSVKYWARGKEYLFPGNDDGHLSAAYVGKRISNLLPEGVSMHSLRHRFATRVHNATGDLLLTQKLLGHSSPSTTQLYVAIEQNRLREAVNAVA
ncbi:tyrosine-type recombinase/integrase [Arcanobacterium hippocoleae]